MFHYIEKEYTYTLSTSKISGKCLHRTTNIHNYINSHINNIVS